MSVGVGEIMAELIADGQVSYRVKNMMKHLSPD
jgi:hypothetical protein